MSIKDLSTLTEQGLIFLSQALDHLVDLQFAHLQVEHQDQTQSKDQHLLEEALLADPVEGHLTNQA